MNDIFNYVVSRLANEKISSPRLEARMLFSYIIGVDAQDIIPTAIDLTSQQMQQLEERLQHKPLCKFLGTKAFYKYNFIVNEDVLSPRPDTEILVETAVEICQKLNAKRILDLGTGSGCVLLSILGELSGVEGAGLDISQSALDVARKNAKLLKMTERCRFTLGSWFDNTVDFGETFDVIVSNPPYIPSGDISGLDPEVKYFDPITALDGGADGLRDYRRIAEYAPKIMNAGGRLLLEFGAGQAQDVSEIFASMGWLVEEIRKDLSGKERCIILKK